MKETLLEKFIRQGLESHAEPKKRVPKGERRGLSRPKLHAASLMLTNDPLRDIAKAVGVSYGFLVVWRTREEFRQKAAELEAEFITLFSNHLKESRSRMRDEFKDVLRYGDSLLLNIFDSVSSVLENESNLQPLFLVFSDLFKCDRQFHFLTEDRIMGYKALCLADLRLKIQSAGLSNEDFHLFHTFWDSLIMRECKVAADKFERDRSESLKVFSEFHEKLSKVQEMCKSVFRKSLGKNWEKRLREISNTPGKGDPLLAAQFRSANKIVSQTTAELTWVLDLNRRVQRILDRENPWEWLNMK